MLLMVVVGGVLILLALVEKTFRFTDTRTGFSFWGT